MEKFKILQSLPLYEVSNLGNVKRIDSGKILKPCIRNGYYSATLYQNNKQYKKYIHRLVAEVFIGDVTNLVINHIDGNKVNNHISNLEIVTPSENNYHAYRLKLKCVTDKQKKALSRKKQVVDLETGIFYDSLKSACEINNDNYTAIRKRIMRKSNNIRFVYV